MWRPRRRVAARGHSRAANEHARAGVSRSLVSRCMGTRMVAGGTPACRQVRPGARRAAPVGGSPTECSRWWTGGCGEGKDRHVVRHYTSGPDSFSRPRRPTNAAGARPTSTAKSALRPASERFPSVETDDDLRRRTCPRHPCVRALRNWVRRRTLRGLGFMNTEFDNPILYYRQICNFILDYRSLDQYNSNIVLSKLFYI